MILTTTTTTTTNRTITRTITSTSTTTTTTTDPCETATCAQQAFAPPESGRGKHIRNVRGPPLSTSKNEKHKRAGACCILVVVVVVVSVCWDGRISRKPRFPPPNRQRFGGSVPDGNAFSRQAPDSLNDKQLSIYIQISKYRTPTKLSK